MQCYIARLVEAQIWTTTIKQSSGSKIINPGPPLDVRRPTRNTTMEHHPHDKNVREDNHEHPPREGRNMEDHPQEASQQLVNEDRTIKNWEEGLNQDGSSEEKCLESIVNSLYTTISLM